MTYDWTFIAGVTIVGASVVAVAVTLILWLCKKISAEKLLAVWRKVTYAVQSAEMLLGPGTGDQKKQYALDLLESWGVKVTDWLLAMLEAAVMEYTHTNVPGKFDDEDEENSDAENAEA